MTGELQPFEPLVADGNPVRSLPLSIVPDTEPTTLSDEPGRNPETEPVVGEIISSEPEDERNWTLREQLWTTPARVAIRSTRIGNAASKVGEKFESSRVGKATFGIVDAAAADTVNGPGSVALVGSSAVIAEILDRRRLILEVMPPRAIHRMEAMHFDRFSSLAAAAIFSTGFAVWTFGSSEVLNRAIDRYPELTDRFIKQFPRITKAAQNAIPKKLETLDEPEPSTLDKVKFEANPKRILRRFKRGFSGVFLGTTIFVGTAAADGLDRKERTKLNGEVTINATASVFVLSAGILEGIRQSVLHNSVETAQRIMANAESDTNWSRASWAVILGTMGLNWLARKGVDDEQAEAIAEPHQPNTATQSEEAV